MPWKPMVLLVSVVEEVGDNDGLKFRYGGMYFWF